MMTGINNTVTERNVIETINIELKYLSLAGGLVTLSFCWHP